MLGNSLDDQVLIPVRLASSLFNIDKNRFSALILVKPLKGVSNEDLKVEVSGAIRAIRKLKPIQKDNFALNEVSLLSDRMDDIFGFLGTMGLVIGIFSVLVGGFGIANIMFVSVKERTSIIGIQKSLGSKNYFILMQFLAESVILCIIGGIVGLIIIWLGTLLANFYIDDLNIRLSLSNIILGITISMLIGIISGFIPSYSASQLDPVEAIRQN